MKPVQKGFTLIELMIVVAIIGILASVAVPAYSNYQSKAKVTAGLAEIAGYKTEFELLTNSGVIPSATTMPNAVKTTANCDIKLTGTTITCDLQNTPSQITGTAVVLTRIASTGDWTCTTTADEQYEPGPSCKGV